MFGSRDVSSKSEDLGRDLPALATRVDVLLLRNEKQLSQLVYDVATSKGYTGLCAERPLASNLICGIASHYIALTGLLAGMDCGVYKRLLPVKSPYKLKEVLVYGSHVHKLAAFREGHDTVIADGGYLQFVRTVTEALPERDILVLNAADVKLKAEQFAALNSESSFAGKIRIMPDQGPGTRKVDHSTVDISIESFSLTKYIQNVWNLSSGEFAPVDGQRSLKKSVLAYLCSDLAQVKPEHLSDIQKLIEYKIEFD